MIPLAEWALFVESLFPVSGLCLCFPGSVLGCVTFTDIFGWNMSEWQRRASGGAKQFLQSHGWEHFRWNWISVSRSQRLNIVMGVTIRNSDGSHWKAIGKSLEAELFQSFVVTKDLTHLIRFVNPPSTAWGQNDFFVRHPHCIEEQLPIAAYHCAAVAQRHGLESGENFRDPLLIRHRELEDTIEAWQERKLRARASFMTL